MITGTAVRFSLLRPVRKHDYGCSSTASITATGARNMTTSAMIRLLLLLPVRRYDYRSYGTAYITANGAEIY